MIYLLGFLTGLGYLLTGLLLALWADERWGRVSLFIADSLARLGVLMALWPLVLPLSFLPRFRPGRGAQRNGTIEPWDVA